MVSTKDNRFIQGKAGVSTPAITRFLLTLTLLIFYLSPVQAEKITVMVLNSIGIAIEENIAAFTEQTGIEVELLTFGNWFELMEKLPTMAAGGIAPDVVYHDTNSQADLYHKGVLMPVEEFVVRDNFPLDMWPQPLVDGLRIKGVLYSLPTAISNWVTFYNTNKMHAAGLSDLPSDWDSQDFTFDDLLDYARKLTIDVDGDGAPDQRGLSGFLSTGGIQAIHLWDLDWIDDDQTEFVGTSAAHIEAMMDIRQLWQLDVVGGSWMNGLSVMMPQQTYYLNTIRNAMEQGGFFDWNVGVLPKAVCRCIATSFHSIGLVRGGSNPDGGWEFLKYVATDPAMSLAFSRAENRVPVSIVAMDDFLSRWEMINPGMSAHVFTTSINHIVKPNWSGLPRQLYDQIGAALNSIVRGDADPKNAMETLKPAIDAILNEINRG